MQASVFVAKDGNQRLLYIDGNLVHSYPADLDYFKRLFPRGSLKGSVCLGGAGMQLDLRFLLTFPEITKIVVVEKVPEVLKIKTSLLPPEYSYPINDERVEYVIDDFYDYICRNGKKFDVLLDTTTKIEQIEGEK